MRFGKKALSGQTLIMFCLVSIVLVMAMGLAIDASGAWWMKQKQDDALELAKEAVISRSNEIKFTNSTQAAVSVAQNSIQENLGAPGTVYRLWAYEVPESNTGQQDRLIGVEVEVEQKYKCAFAQTFGFKELEVKSHICFTINPYSSSTVWRPDNTAGCRAIQTDNGLQMDLNLTYDQLPEELKSCIETALKDLD